MYEVLERGRGTSDYFCCNGEYILNSVRIGPKATKRKEERDRIEKEHKEKMEALEEEKIDLDINGTNVRLHKKPKLKKSIYKIKSNR